MRTSVSNLGFRRQLPFLVLPLLLALAASCGGDKQDDSAKLEQAIAAVDPRQILQDVILTTSDLPAGSRVEDEEFASNEDWAKGQFQLLEPEADSLTRSQKNGRLLSLVLEFEIPDLNPPVIRLGQPVLYLVTASVTLYGNLEGAKADYQFFESKLNAFKEQQMQEMRESPLGFSNVRAEQGQVGSLGDQSFSLRFLADRRLFGATVPLVFDATEFRRGQFLVIVVTGTTVRSDGTAAHELGETLVDRIDEKVKELQR